jgi:hypothetical protein
MLAMYLLTRDARKRQHKAGVELRKEGILNDARMELVQEREMTGLRDPKPSDRKHTKGRLPDERH